MFHSTGRRPVSGQGDFQIIRFMLDRIENLHFENGEDVARLKRDRILVRYMNYLGWGDGLRISVGADAEVDVCLEKLKLMV